MIVIKGNYYVKALRLLIIFFPLFSIIIRLKARGISRGNRIACGCSFFWEKCIFFLYDLFYTSSVILISHFFIFLFDCYMLKYVIFSKVLLLMLVHRIYIKYLMYPRQEPASN